MNNLSNRKNIYYIVKSTLHYYPPCVSQIRILNDIGINVTVLYGSSDEIIIKKLEDEGITCIQLTDPRNILPSKLDKVNNWISFRNSLQKFLKKIDNKNAILWFGNAETIIPMYGALRKWNYVVSFLELLDTHKYKLFALKRIARNAKIVTVCEETRAYLMKNWFDLKQLPYIIPNKPYNIEFKRGEVPTTETGKAILDITNGEKFVISQGVLQNSEFYTVIAHVLHDKYPDMYLILIGIDKYNIFEEVKAIHDKTFFFDYIPAPMHLQITANAYIGLVFYRDDQLNKVFCAPNKIFEYSFFGVPIIANNLPGLKNTIGKANAGICVEFTYENIADAFEIIENHYEEISINGVNFYNSVDNVSTINKIVEKLMRN